MNRHIQFVLGLGEPQRGRLERTLRRPRRSAPTFSRQPVPRVSPTSGLDHSSSDRR